MPRSSSVPVTYTSPMISNSSSISLSDNTSAVSDLMYANGIYDRYDMDWFTKFARFPIMDPYNALLTTKEYVFITKPDLCILSNSSTISPVVSSSPFFVDAVNRYRNVIHQLQSSVCTNEPPFMTVLSNSLTSTLDLPGLSADTVETSANVFGTKITYRGTSSKSDEDHDFNLEFEDNKYLDVYMLFKIWDEYEKMKWNGALDFSKASSERWTNYIKNKILHDQVSMYKFVVDDTGYRIVYFARIVGCMPTSIPRDAFSDMTNSDPQKITVGWKGHFVRDMDPIIISNFNSLVSAQVKKGSDMPLYDNSSRYAMHMDGRFAASPYVDVRNVTDGKHGYHREYYLRWVV